jgi:radical SAM superfamily enzyme YgiQ (UPF0313 family)
MLAHASFMVGLPGETKETLAQTAQLAKDLDIVYGYHFLAPFPGTTVREKVHNYDLQILTDKWDKYDANDAIVRTAGASPAELREFVARFDNEIEEDWQRQLRGYDDKTNTPMEDLQIEGHWRMNLTFKILKDDLIEKYGFIESALFEGSKDKALNALIQKISACTNDKAAIADSAIRDFVRRGYLKAVQSDQGCAWSWT